MEVLVTPAGTSGSREPVRAWQVPGIAHPLVVPLG